MGMAEAVSSREGSGPRDIRPGFESQSVVADADFVGFKDCISGSVACSPPLQPARKLFLLVI